MGFVSSSETPAFISGLGPLTSPIVPTIVVMGPSNPQSQALVSLQQIQPQNARSQGESSRWGTECEQKGTNLGRIGDRASRKPEGEFLSPQGLLAPSCHCPAAAQWLRPTSFCHSPLASPTVPKGLRETSPHSSSQTLGSGDSPALIRGLQAPPALLEARQDSSASALPSSPPPSFPPLPSH